MPQFPWISGHLSQIAQAMLGEDRPFFEWITFIVKVGLFSA